MVTDTETQAQREANQFAAEAALAEKIKSLEFGSPQATIRDALSEMDKVYGVGTPKHQKALRAVMHNVSNKSVPDIQKTDAIVDALQGYGGQTPQERDTAMAAVLDTLKAGSAQNLQNTQAYVAGQVLNSRIVANNLESKAVGAAFSVRAGDRLGLKAALNDINAASQATGINYDSLTSVAVGTFAQGVVPRENLDKALQIATREPLPARQIDMPPFKKRISQTLREGVEDTTGFGAVDQAIQEIAQNRMSLGQAERTGLANDIESMLAFEEVSRLRAGKYDPNAMTPEDFAAITGKSLPEVVRNINQMRVVAMIARAVADYKSMVTGVSSVGKGIVSKTVKEADLAYKSAVVDSVSILNDVPTDWISGVARGLSNLLSGNLELA